MGFYLRKSLSVGPFRFNLSKSGVGVSTGFKGLRIGAGPRGNYVHMGRGGLYYRATLPQFSSNSGESVLRSSSHQQQSVPIEEPLQEIESVVTSTIVDSSSEELVKEMNSKRRLYRFWPGILACGLFFAFLAAWNDLPNWLIIILILLTGAVSYVASVYDKLRKTTVLFYDLESDIEASYQALHDAFNGLISCSTCWHISAQGDIKDWKRNSGASAAVKRSSIRIGKGNPPFVKSNVSVPFVPVGKQTLYFFPDKVLVFEPNAVGAVSYKNLNTEVSSTRFIESGSVPRDAQIVDKTWRYINKKGGPDKRFKDNRELPIALYEDICFTSSTGLNERLQASKVGVGAPISEVIDNLAKVYA